MEGTTYIQRVQALVITGFPQESKAMSLQTMGNSQT